MLKPRRLLVVSGLMGLLAAMAFAAPSQAAKAICAVNGTVKMEDKFDPAFGVRLVGGKGTFAFTTKVGGGLGITCVEIEKQPAVSIRDAEASGWYENIVCGTGKAVGTVDSVDNQKYAWLVGHRFAVEFVDFSGLFYWEASKTGKPGPEKVLTQELNPSDHDPNKDSSGDWELAGDVEIVEANPENKTPEQAPLGNCTKSFDVTASIVVHQP